jgi:cytochrome c biogenesis protein CcmG/thiol:disulfide interchange protein DsbE
MRKLPLLLLGAAAALAACGRNEQPAPEPKPTLTYSGPRGTTQTATSTTSTATATATAAEAAPPDTSVGKKMPAFAAETLEGQPFDLAKERGSDVVFLNVWATWCGPCIGEMPDLMKMHEHYAPQGFKVVGVSIDDSGVEPVKDFLKEHKVSYPIALDSESHVANVLQTTVLPTSVLIDRTGTIVWRHFGSVKFDDAELLKALDAALAQKRT